MLLRGARARRDTYLGIAAATMAAAYLLGVAANISFYVRDQFTFLGSALAEAGWLLQEVCGGRVLLIAGFAAAAIAFMGGTDARPRRMRLGALLLAGGYGLLLVGGALSLPSRDLLGEPDGVYISYSGMVVQSVAFLPASVGALLVAIAFSRPRFLAGVNVAVRNRRLGWASIGFGLEFVLLLLSGLLSGRRLEGGRLDLWDVGHIAALAAAFVAAAGFFGAARGSRLDSPSALPRREGIIACAAVLFLAYRALELTHPLDLASWLSQLETAALAIAALCAAVGFVVSRRSFQGRSDPSLVTRDD